MRNQPDIDKAYLYVKDPYKAKCQYLINKREKSGLNYYDDLTAFIEYSSDIESVQENIEEYNLRKKRKVLKVFDDMIADVIVIKKINPYSNSNCVVY